MSLSRRVVAYVLVQHASRLESLEHLPTGTTPCPHGTAHPNLQLIPRDLQCQIERNDFLLLRIQSHLENPTLWIHRLATWNVSRRFHGEALIKHIVTFQRQSCGSNRSWRQSMIINISFCWLVQPIWRKKNISKSQNRNGFIFAQFFSAIQNSKSLKPPFVDAPRDLLESPRSQRTAWPG